MVSKLFGSVVFLISGAMLSGCVTTDNANNEGSNVVVAMADTGPAPLAEEAVSSESGDAEVMPDASSDEKSKDDSKKVICKKLEPPTGTRLGGRRICKTKAEWEFMYEQNKIYLRELQSTPGDPNVGQ